ncbi:MAG TPA: alpha/beta hydrolase domain-containing protein [Frankiaceae bacterium]|nr:alpha/beta hydrolase domain-containing protein [Frankiaceae bacterium]
MASRLSALATKVVTVAMGATLLAACSGAGSSPAARSTPLGGRAAGPAAVFSGPVTGGKGINLLTPGKPQSTPDLAESEYFASGTAASYTADATPESGDWSLHPDTKASYRTRIVVRLPKDPKRFNGTVVLEWLNVSAGSDTDPDYAYAAAELDRSGYAWVGVSAQQAGIEGSKLGDIASQLLPGVHVSGLRRADPARYSSLHHPGDAFSYDMFTQVARALRSPGKVDVLDGLRPRRMIAIGESQSAARLTTYVNGVQPLTHEFDGFFIHSRGGGAAPLSGSGDTGTIVDGAYRLRPDAGVPVLVVETESDLSVLRYDQAEQPDSGDVHVWEVAGTSHADAFVAGPALQELHCDPRINAGPQEFVVRAAISGLETWVRTGKAPASAPRLDHDGPVLHRDALGIAIGGVRTPPVDVPVAVQSGEAAPGSQALCTLFGSSRALGAARLKSLYGTKAQYLQRFSGATRQAVSAGYVLPADEAALAAQAQAVDFPS